MNEQSKISIRPVTNRDCERVQNLVFGVLREYRLEPSPCRTDADLADLETAYTERGGVFELLEDEQGNLLGTVGLYPINSEKVELRKMYFAGNLRGKGYGKKLSGG